MSKRSAQRKITKANQVLRHMRRAARLSMREAGHRMSLCGSTINHMEHGRMDLSPFRIRQAVKCYGFKMTDFHSFMEERKEVPLSKLDECIRLLEYFAKALPDSALSEALDALTQIETKARGA